MNRDEKLALFLGMLSGDGCLSVGHNGGGYRNYPIQFCNTNKAIVLLFDNLFYELFGIRGHLTARKRRDRKEIWHFVKISHKIYDVIKNIGFPEGVKRDVLRVPSIIRTGNENEQLLFFQGLLITDGCNKPKRGIMFHLGSKLFLEDLSELLNQILEVRKPVKEFIQREKYKSYQLYLNKNEKEILLSRMPVWDNGTPLVLSVI